MSFRIDITCSHCGKIESLTLDKCAPACNPKDPDTIGIEELELGTREFNALYYASIHTVGQLMRFERPELLRIKNVGRTSLNRIEDALRRFFINQRNPPGPTS